MKQRTRPRDPFPPRRTKEPPSWYRCGFATTKGAAICTYGRGYHRQRLEAAVLAQFRAAMTPPMVSTLTQLVNTHVEAAFRERSRGIEHLKAEILRLEA